MAATQLYAVIETGGKQYRVQAGDIIQVEKLDGAVGAGTQFSNVLLVAKPSESATTLWLGKPTLNGASVGAEIVGQGRGEKLLLVKMKRRKQYRRTQGHRQEYTQLLITSLTNGAGETATLSASDKKEKMAKFQSHLKPRGLGLTPKTLGSKKKLAAKATAAFMNKGGAAPAAKKTAKKTASKSAE